MTKSWCKYGERIKGFFNDEGGSAIVEFVALAIPLFIPVFIYLNSFASVSGNEAVIRVLAREGVRACHAYLPIAGFD